MTFKSKLLAIAGALLAASGANAAGPSAAALNAPVRDERAISVERFFMEGIAHFNRRELDPFLGQFHEDIRMFAVNSWLRGKPALRQRFESTFKQFPKARMEITNLRARSETRNVVTVEFEFHTYPQGTGLAWHGVGSGVYVKTAAGWREVLEHETVTKRDR